MKFLAIIVVIAIALVISIVKERRYRKTITFSSNQNYCFTVLGALYGMKFKCQIDNIEFPKELEELIEDLEYQYIRKNICDVDDIGYLKYRVQSEINHEFNNKKYD